jgi:hypothetical protein
MKYENSNNLENKSRNINILKILLFGIPGILIFVCFAYCLVGLIDAFETDSIPIEMFTIISTMFIVLTFLGVLVALNQLLLSTKAKKDLHEEMRRSKTGDLLFEWCKNRSKNCFYAIKIAEKIANGDNGDTNLDKLLKIEEFDVNEECYKEMCFFCEKRDKCGISYKFDAKKCTECAECNTMKQEVIAKKKFTISGHMLSEFRWNVIQYFNILESVFKARDLGIVDSEVIKEEFSPIFQDIGRKTLLLKMKAIRPDSFPALYKFSQEVEKATQQSKTRPEL